MSGNYRDVNLLPIISRIFPRVLGKRMRNWTENMRILDENQSSLRPNRSTADATQILIHIKGDKHYIRNQRKDLRLARQSSDPEERLGLLDLEKAYLRVSKLALWAILKRLGIKDNRSGVLANWSVRLSNSRCVIGRLVCSLFPSYAAVHRNPNKSRFFDLNLKFYSWRVVCPDRWPVSP